MPDDIDNDEDLNDDAEDDNSADEWYDQKSQLMESILGPEHDMVMHAIIPYAIGGGLDLYYYPNGVEGTGIATKELSEAPDEGSSNERFENYEFVMFTRHPISLDDSTDEATPFGKVHTSINAILNCMAPYSAQATLNVHDTCEFPADMEDLGGRCLIFDGYKLEDSAPENPAPFGLMLIMEVHRSEMEFARSIGCEHLLEKLKSAGHYPYSDMDREPVV